jgi:hypothetical protein
MLGTVACWSAGYVKIMHRLDNGTAQEHTWVVEEQLLYNVPHGFEMCTSHPSDGVGTSSSTLKGPWVLRGWAMIQVARV